MAGGHQAGFEGEHQNQALRDAEERLGKARQEIEAIIDGFRQVTASAGEDPGAGPVYNIERSTGVVINEGAGNSASVSVSSGSGAKSQPKGLEWTRIIVAAIALVSAVAVALIGLYKPDKSEPAAPASLPSSSAARTPEPTKAPTATSSPSPSPVPFVCRESGECPADFAYIGRLYGESNQGNPALHDRREILLPPHFRLDTSYQQPNVNCCGGGATAPLSPADIPRGILYQAGGDHLLVYLGAAVGQLQRADEVLDDALLRPAGLAGPRL